MNDWLKIYEKKAEEYYDAPDYVKITDPEKGFLCYKIKDRVLYLGHTCTNDMSFFERKVIKIAKAEHCKKIKTITMRNPRAYIRMTHGHLILSESGYRPNGLWYWSMERDIERTV